MKKIELNSGRMTMNTVRSELKISRIIEALNARPMSIRDAAKALFMSFSSAGYYFKHLAELPRNDPRRIFVSDWRRSKNGNIAAIYSVGSGVNKKRPGIIWNAERHRQYRAENPDKIRARRRVNSVPVLNGATRTVVIDGKIVASSGRAAA